MLQFITIIFYHKQYSNVLKVPKTSRVSSAISISIIISETKKTFGAFLIWISATCFPSSGTGAKMSKT